VQPRARELSPRACLPRRGGAIAALALGEGLVRVLDLRAFRPALVLEDPELGFRFAPDRGELDAWGFRNARVPERAEIVCLGDSQTYGVGVRADEAWPAVLARESGASVYTMAQGGYGPLQALVLAERAEALSPRVIVFALYLGNDVQDAWGFAGLPRWEEMRASGIEYPADPGGPAREGQAPNLAMTVADALEAHSRLLGRLVSGFEERLRTARYLADVHGGEGAGLAWEEGPLFTLFTPAYRLRALDLGSRTSATACASPSSASNASRRSLASTRRLRTPPRAHQGACLPALRLERDPRSRTLAALAAAEERIAAELEARARERGIVVIDPVPELILARARRALPPTPDGTSRRGRHPRRNRPRRLPESRRPPRAATQGPLAARVTRLRFVGDWGQSGRSVDSDRNLPPPMPPLLLAAISSATLVLHSPRDGAEGSSTALEFNRDVRPILAENCYACHGPDKGKRKAGLRLDQREVAMDKGVLSPGSPEESELVRRIFSSDPEEQMPPPESRKSLSEAQKHTLETCIATGAEYQAHWAYTPLVRPAVPSIALPERAANPIDAFLLERLDLLAITPSPAADRRTLLRRLSLDLLGLPPTPADVAAFVADERPDAWERAIERCLESPHYGERMAVAWLDLARFADTVGYHGDQNVDVFPYRDWVVDAFNTNEPFDRFTIEQLAGDLLPDRNERTLVATAFNRLNMVTREGGAQPGEYLAKYAADRVRTVAGTWLGSTLGCAECHDHKFDPFTTRDFYRLEAFFADVTQWGVYQDYDYTPNPDLRGWSNDHPFPPEIEVESPYLVQRIATIERRMAELLTNRDGFAAWQERSRRFVTEHPDGWLVTEPRLLASENEDQSKHIAGTLESDGSLFLAGGLGEPVVIRVPLEESTLAAIRLELLPDERNGGTVVRGGGESTWVGLGARLVPGDGGEPVPLAFHHADADRKEARFANGFEVLGTRSGWVTSKAHTKEAQTGVWQLEKPLGVGPDRELEVTLAYGSAGRVRLSVSPFATRELLERDCAAAVGNARGLETYLLSTDREQEASAEYHKLLRELRECRGGKARVVVTAARTPLVTRVLKRGNWQDESGEIVEPGVPGFLPQPPSVEGKRLDRLDLARWLVSRENPLTARTFVNRLWKQLFGTALSSVVDDLGTQGEWPFYDELLGLARRRVRRVGLGRSTWSGLIAASAACRRDSGARRSRRDRSREPLARAAVSATPEAEFVRDNALYVSGFDARPRGRARIPISRPATTRTCSSPIATTSLRRTSVSTAAGCTRTGSGRSCTRCSPTSTHLRARSARRAASSRTHRSKP
jgi:hypothetical protein